MSRLTVGQALIKLLEKADVDTVFGIPGVHTIELYRGLEGSTIRHITPRHEQGAAFMADGYARATGKPGVCLLITGPGFTNALTGIMQARADSIPMLIITGVNARESLGKERGHLHEVPDQAALSRTICCATLTLMEPENLGDVMRVAFVEMMSGRPGPVHIEIPTDVMSMKIDLPDFEMPQIKAKAPTAQQIEEVARLCNAAKKPLILAGGGTKMAGAAVRLLAKQLDAPVVTTVNARGILAGDPLEIPASPSLQSIRSLIEEADLVLALGTEIGPTDYDMYEKGLMLEHPNFVRVDVCPKQLAKRDDKSLKIEADAGAFSNALCAAIDRRERGGASRSALAREDAFGELSPAYQHLINILQALWKVYPNARLVGDSTQLTYAGNLYLETPAAGLWFNSATGFGTLGYGAPAAIGAALGDEDTPTICLIGDGGLQFTLAELGSATDARANVIFLVWNNSGYKEIESAMVNADIQPIGVAPSAPDFTLVAKAFGLATETANSIDELLQKMKKLPRPRLINFKVKE